MSWSSDQRLQRSQKIWTAANTNEAHVDAMSPDANMSYNNNYIKIHFLRCQPVNRLHHFSECVRDKQVCSKDRNQTERTDCRVTQCMWLGYDPYNWKNKLRRRGFMPKLIKVISAAASIRATIIISSNKTPPRGFIDFMQRCSKYWVNLGGNRFGKSTTPGNCTSCGSVEPWPCYFIASGDVF